MNKDMTLTHYNSFRYFIAKLLFVFFQLSLVILSLSCIYHFYPGTCASHIIKYCQLLILSHNMTITKYHTVRGKASRYQRVKQKPYVKAELKIQWPPERKQDKQRSENHYTEYYRLSNMKIVKTEEISKPIINAHI